MNISEKIQEEESENRLSEHHWVETELFKLVSSPMVEVP